VLWDVEAIFDKCGIYEWQKSVGDRGYELGIFIGFVSGF
jgi:hypothetical protein